MTPAQYGEFIAQIELLDIWVKAATLTNAYGPRGPQDLSIALSSHASFENNPDSREGFAIDHTYTARFEHTDTALATVEVTFGLHFGSQLELTADIFQIFEEVNLPVNTWPYLREYLSATVGRMGWLPLTLPSLKRGTPKAKRSSSARKSPTTRSARSRQETLPL